MAPMRHTHARAPAFGAYAGHEEGWGRDASAPAPAPARGGPHDASHSSSFVPAFGLAADARCACGHGHSSLRAPQAQRTLIRFGQSSAEEQPPAWHR
jgi:hypothetical protein